MDLNFLIAGTLALAYREAYIQSKRQKISVMRWVTSGADPSTSVVFLEDLAAVLGVVVASTAMAVSAWTGQTWPDALGGVLVAGILGSVAFQIVHSNTEMLIGKAIPEEKREAIMSLVDNAKIVRGTYDIKATMLGGEMVRFKAEVDIDGRELTKRYLETLPLDLLLQKCSS
ncbi:unnamed protein product [Protopolystoma xenopodis]|uniref:Cation efflux protein transmembrane domain-containing protein n=1 Tax=Protopolystoma xenopodis TaxID=117903 RepID=A0A3S5B2R7_9PLAT|nr:unnamed protein product [Protopolystoma xenopodis]